VAAASSPRKRTASMKGANDGENGSDKLASPNVKKDAPEAAAFLSRRTPTLRSINWSGENRLQRESFTTITSHEPNTTTSVQPVMKIRIIEPMVQKAARVS